MHILIIDNVHDILIQKLREKQCHVDYKPSITKKEAEKILPYYNGIIIRSKFPLNKEFLSYGKKLQFIGRVGAGLENIDQAFAKEKGIICLNSPEGNKTAVGEQALGMLLSVMNNINNSDKEVRQGLWKREENRGNELSALTVGIIGYGNMGSAFARTLKGVGCNVIAYDKYKYDFSDEYVREVTLDQLQDESDVLSIHIPLTEETNYMINRRFIQQFRKPIWFINTSRGKIVHTEEIVSELENGKIKGAALDVLELEKTNFEELHETDNLPGYFKKLIHMNNVLLTPHIAGWTHESNRKLSEVMANKIIVQFDL